VISVSLQDQLRDYSSVIPFFFDQHTFQNLRSCVFYSIASSKKFDNVIEKLESFNKLVSFRIFQPDDTPLSEDVKRKLSQTILMHRSYKLRTVELMLHYNYLELTVKSAINWILTSLSIKFHGVFATYLVYRTLPILGIYRSLRVFRVTVIVQENFDNNQRM
jgi:hypothetical protein